MLATNQRLDQMAAARVNFTTQNMLDGTLLESVLAENGEYIQCSLSLSHVTHFFSDVEEESSDLRSERPEPEGKKEAESSVADEDIHGVIIDDNVPTGVKLAQTTRELT